MRLRRAGALVGLVALTLLSGCGGSGSEDKAAVEHAEDGAVASLKVYLTSFQSGEAKKACDLETPEYARTQVAGAVAQNLLPSGATCEDLVNTAIAAAKQMGADFASVSSVTTKVVESSGNHVTVLVSYPAGQVASAETYGLVLTDGTWLVDSKQSTVTQATSSPTTATPK